MDPLPLRLSRSLALPRSRKLQSRKPHLPLSPASRNGRSRANSSIISRPTPVTIGTCPSGNSATPKDKPRPKTRPPSRRLEDEEESLFGAAYEQVTYRDTTDDGMESSTFDTEPDQTESELSFEVERITDNLQFLATLAHLWKFTATVTLPDDAPPGERDEILGGWLKQAEHNYQALWIY